MEKLLYFFVHYGTVAVIVLLVALRRPRSLAGLWSATALFCAVASFVFLWGQWPLVGSWHARWLPAAAATLALLHAIRATRRGLPLRSGSWLADVAALVAVGIAAWIATAVVNALAGREYAEPAVALEFPLKGGRYYVSSGGSSRVINNHMRDYPNAQQYALDIHKLGPAGGASANVFSTANEGHYIFGEAVFAPCDGVVSEAADGAPDNAFASMDVKPGDGPDNHVYLDCDGVIIALSHLKAGSIVVRTGDQVATGQRLGAVGNSGFSQEPHLHLQAAARDKNGALHGVPMRFDGQTYARNDLVEMH